MICPICQKRKAKRHCPAKSEMICAICCGTEREVTIDCPLDCPHLVASRQHYDSRRAVDWAKVPFADQRIPQSVLEVHEQLFTEFWSVQVRIDPWWIPMCRRLFKPLPKPIRRWPMGLCMKNRPIIACNVCFMTG